MRYRDIAVLYRAHYASRPVEEALVKAEIPYALTSGVPFFGRKEVKDALSYLRLIAYQGDLSFARVANTPKRNLGQRRMAFLQEVAQREECTLFQALQRTVDDDIFKGTKARALLKLVDDFQGAYEGKPVSEVLAALMTASGYERALRTEGSQERLDNLAELKQAIYEFETTCGEEVTLEHYLSHVALLTNADAVSDGRDQVRLMTIHAAKGLEFPHVFLCSLSEGVLPSKKTRTPATMEEERRLAFVAMTRARDGLYLSEAEGFSHQGASRYPSRFFAGHRPGRPTVLEPTHRRAPAAGPRLHRRHGPVDSRPWPRRDTLRSGRPRAPQDLRPRHRLEAIDLTKRAYLVRFDAMDTPRALSFRAPLEEG